MTKRKKIPSKSTSKKKKEEEDPISKTKKRLELQQKALKKIIEQFNKNKNDT